MARNTNGAFKSLGKWGNQLQWTGRQLQYNWTLPILAATGAATKFALDQERAMTRVRKVYGDASMSSKQMQNETKALERAFVALSNKYGVTIEETANIAAEWAAAGASGIDLGKDVEQTMKTMVLGELDAAEATKALIAIQAQYGFNSAELADTLARMNAIENATGTTTGDLITAMSRAAGVAREAGVSVTELGGMIAALTPAAGSASEAGNALKTMISRLLSPTGDAVDILGAMGIEIQDAGWQSMNATARIELMANKFEDLTDSQKAVVSATVASRYHINKFSVLLDAVNSPTSYYATALRVAGDNANYFAVAEKELNTVLNSNPQKVKQVGVILQNSMVKVIQPLIPIIVGLAQWIGNLAQKFSNLDPNLRKLIVVGFLFLAMLGIVARYVGSLATLISVLGRTFFWLGKPIMGALRFFGLFRVAATAELAATTATAAVQTASTTAVMRAQLLRGLPGLTGVWTRIKNFAIMQMVALNLGVSRRLIILRNTMNLVWFSIWGTMRSAAVAGIGKIQAVIAARLLPYFGATLLQLRGAVMARWAIIWTQMTLMSSIGMLAIRARMAAGFSALGGLLATAAGPFIRFGAQLPMLFTQAWGAVANVWYAGLLRLRGMSFSFGRAYSAVMSGIGRVVGGVWSAMGRALWAIQWGIYRGLTAITTAGGTLLTRAWALVGRAMQAIQWGLMGALSRISIAGQVLLARAWQAGGVLLRRVQAATLTYMRAQWMAFVIFMRTPGALAGAFRSMGGVIAAGGRGLIGILTALRTGLIAVITSPWFIAVAIVVGAIILFRDQIAKIWNNIKNYFSNANNGIVKTFDALPNGIKGAFQKVIAFVKAAAQKVYEWMQYLNPFARHSPSLVDNVTKGLAVVRSQFGTLTQIAGPIAQAYKGINDLKQASAGLRQGAASIQLAEDIKKLSETAPLVVPAFRALAGQLTGLQAKADALEAAVNDQETTTRVWKMALDDASDALDRQQKILDSLKDVASGYEDQINSLNQEIETLANTPLTGMQAMADEIFENELAQKRLKLAIMDMEDAGQSYDDVKNRIASLNGELEGLRGTQADLRAAGAGSDILSFYDDQIKAIEDQKGAMQEQVGPIAEASKAIEDLQRQAERLDLEQALKFDPLTRQIQQASSTMKEMPFDEIISGIQRNQTALVPLQAAYDQASAAVKAQEANVKAAQAVHDEIQASYDAENLKLQVLKDSYGDVSSAISDVTSALSDMTAAADIAHQSADGAISPALENFNAAAAGGDFANVGGDATIGGMPHGDQSADIDAWAKQMEDELGGSFGGMDMFAPIKEMWNKFTAWWDTTVGTFFSGGAAGEFLGDAFEGVDFLQPIKDVWADVGAIFTETDWEGIIGDVWDSVSNWFSNVWDFVEIFKEILGPDVMETFYIIRDNIVKWWDEIQNAFTGGKVGDAIGAMTDAFDAFWNFVFPILQGLWAIFLMVVQVIWSAVNGVLGPVLEWIGKMFGNIWDIIVGFWNVIAGIFTGDWSRVWEGVKGIFSGVWDSIVDTLFGVGKVIVGFIVGIASGVWDNIKWIWDKIVQFGGWVWDKMKAVGSAIGDIFIALGNAFMWVWDHSIGWVFNKLGDFLSQMPGWWQTASDAIGKAWDTIKEKARAPIQWVIDFVWNDGLRNLWNKINNLWGGDDIDRFTFAKGGVMPGYTPGRDVHKFFSPTAGILELSGGEGILRPEATRAIGGREGIAAINKAATTGGVDAVRDMLTMQPQYFANGGVVSIPGWISGILDWIPGMGWIKDIIDNINGGKGGVGGGDFASGLLKLPGVMLGKIWDQVKSWWDDDSPKTEGGIQGTGGGSQIDRMFRAVKSVFPRAKLNSGQRDTNDYHGRGKAVDLGETGFAGGSGRQYLADMEEWIFKHVANVAELIYDGIGNKVSDLKNAQRHTYNAQTQREHQNHTHWAMDSFDDGGIMAHGRGGWNSSGRPERVLSARQTQTFDRLLSFLEQTGIPSPEALEGAIFKATAKANAAESIGNQTIVNGDLGTTNITNNFYGDLSFPNITDPDDADTFLQNLSDLAPGSRH